MSAAHTTPDELRDFGESVERVLGRLADGPVAFENQEGAVAELWGLSASLGWTGLGLDVERGGSGGGLPELAVLHRALGRWAAPGPHLGTSIAASLLATASAIDVDVQKVLAEGVALAVPTQGSSGEHVVVHSGAAERWTLVIDDHSTTLVSGVPGGDERHLGFDPGFSATTMRIEGRAGTSLDTAQCRRILAVLVAAACNGISERMVAVTVDYAKQRHQFGRPIGSFQAVKHRAADMAIRHRASYASLLYAIDCVVHGREDSAQAVDTALHFGTSAALTNAEACLETHGAMGHTWEFTGHRFLKRAHVLRGIASAALTGGQQEVA